MTTTQAAHGQPPGVVLGREWLALALAAQNHVFAAGAANVKLAPVFGIQIQQEAAGEQVFRQVVGAVHAGFFVDGEQRLQRRMGDVIAFQHRQHGGHANAVVGAQAGAARAHPAIVGQPGLNRVAEKIMGVAVLLAHHVHMALQHHGFPFGHAGAGGFADQKIAGGVLRPVQAARAGPAAQVVHHLAFVARGARQSAQRGKVPPQRGRRQIKGQGRQSRFRHGRRLAIAAATSGQNGPDGRAGRGSCLVQ
jgi:hypothetical protein